MTNPSAETPATKPSRDDAVSEARKRVATTRGTDPAIAWLSFTIFAVIVVVLIAVIYGLMTGVFGSGAPRTHEQAKIEGSLAQIEGGSTNREDWRDYILGLIETGQYSQAEKAIELGKKKLKDEVIYNDTLYLEAELLLAQKKYDEALKTSDLGLKKIKARYNQGKQEYEKEGKPDPAFSTGLVDTYWDILLIKAEIYETRQDWKNALKVYNEYLAEKKMAANVFSQRGAVKEKLGDKAGAKADYKQTLVFIPDDKTALEGLKRIGAQ